MQALQLKKVLVAAVMAAGVMFAVGCGPSNPLIGDWKLAGGIPGCETSLKFSSNDLVAVSPVVGTHTAPVTYNVSPKLVYVMTNGNTVEYNIADSDHMSYTTAWGTCSYQK